MRLFNRKTPQRQFKDTQTETLLKKTIEFFEEKGLKNIKKDDLEGVWYSDFLKFVAENQVFYHFLGIPLDEKDQGRFDMWRISEMNETLGFYGLCYWYCWQVSILGLGPIWMSQNQQIQKKAKSLLKEGGIFAYGLSEKDHGADIYSTEMTLHLEANGGYKANGRKYYIGNGNCAAMVSVFGKIAETNEYVFFVVDTQHKNYKCVKKIETSGVRQAFVSEFELSDYPISENEILSRGKEAFSTALNTVNVGKFQLGFAAIGIASHAMEEAVKHASHRVLYGKAVTNFAHVKNLFIESYCRLVAAKLYGQRACDYMRHASLEDRRYLLFNSIMKMKVTSEAEKIVGQLHEVIAAKGFEQDTYFEMALRDIPMLPKLEGTVHVNMALINKFMKNYFFSDHSYKQVPIADEPVHDHYLFSQNSQSMGEQKFPSYSTAYKDITGDNVKIFKEQLDTYRELLKHAGPDSKQIKNVDFMLSLGELFSLGVYSQLILENTKLLKTDVEIVKGIYKFLIKDFSHFALHITLNFELSNLQEKYLQEMIKKPIFDNSDNEVWENHIAKIGD